MAIRRGDNAHTPIVAIVRRSDGGLINQAIAVDTANRRHAVQRSLSAKESKILLDDERVVGART